MFSFALSILFASVADTHVPAVFLWKNYGQEAASGFVINLSKAPAFIEAALEFLNQEPPPPDADALILHDLIAQLRDHTVGVLFAKRESGLSDGGNSYPATVAGDVNDSSASSGGKTPPVTPQKSPALPSAVTMTSMPPPFPCGNSTGSRGHMVPKDDDDEDSDGYQSSADTSTSSISAKVPGMSKQLVTKVSIGSFFSNYMVTLPLGLQRSARNSVEYLVSIGLTPKALENWYVLYRLKLEHENIFDVSTGVGDCQLRALLGWIVANKIRTGEELSVDEKCLIALCGFIFDCCQEENGRNSVLGCRVSESLTSLDPCKLPPLDTCMKKTPFNPKRPDIFVAHVKNIITLHTLAATFGSNVHSLPITSTLLSGIQIPTVSHELSFNLLWAELIRRGIPYFITLMHFNTAACPERQCKALSANYGLVRPYKGKISPDTLCVNFNYYTVNYTALEQEEFHEQMEDPEQFQQSLIECGRNVDTENSLATGSRTARQFGKQVLMARLAGTTKHKSVFHIETGTFAGVLNAIAFNREVKGSADFHPEQFEDF